MVCGNHDSYFDTRSRTAEDKASGAKLGFKSVHYLEDKSIALKLNGRELNFYGAPEIPKCGGSSFAFQYNRNNPPWKGRIPQETDVLITHIPPRHHRDLNLGCTGLLEEIWKVKPRLHVFGHIHAAYGKESVFWDKGQMAYERLMSSKKGGILGDIIPSRAWLDAFRIVWYGVRAVLWQRLMIGSGGSNGGIMVNAALHRDATKDLSYPIEVVEL